MGFLSLPVNMFLVVENSVTLVLDLGAEISLRREVAFLREDFMATVVDQMW